MAAGAGIAPAFAPSKGAVLRLDDPAILKNEDGEWKIEDGLPSVAWNPGNEKSSLARPMEDILRLEFVKARIRGEGWWPARVARPVQQIKSLLHHFNACRPKIGSPSRSSTSEGWCSRQDLHLHCRRFELRASALGYAGGRMALPVGFAPTLNGV